MQKSRFNTTNSFEKSIVAFIHEIITFNNYVYNGALRLRKVNDNVHLSGLVLTISVWHAFVDLTSVTLAC